MVSIKIGPYTASITDDMTWSVSAPTFASPRMVQHTKFLARHLARRYGSGYLPEHYSPWLAYSAATAAARALGGSIVAVRDTREQRPATAIL